MFLDHQVFESTLKAKIRFPEVFEVSPAQRSQQPIGTIRSALLTIVSESLSAVMDSSLTGANGVA
jgi:hypothetical protein